MDPEPEPDPQLSVRIRTKMSRIWNTGTNDYKLSNICSSEMIILVKLEES